MEAAYELEQDDSSRETAATGYPLLTRVTYQLVLHTQALRKLFNTPEPRVSRFDHMRSIKFGMHAEMHLQKVLHRLSNTLI